ncbi:MAG: TIGR04086 family membrane protein [Turicibacter sp.]|nr:TIGR04086 family membrane protein [Turicibacter sp.]
MTEKLGKAILSGFSFVGISVPIASLIITTIAYFDLIPQAVLSGLLFGSFIVIFFMASLRTAQKIGQKGWAVGAAIAAAMTVLSLMYTLIGIEQTPGLQFLVRTAISTVTCITGGMIGVNLSK